MNKVKGGECSENVVTKDAQSSKFKTVPKFEEEVGTLSEVSDYLQEDVFHGDKMLREEKNCTSECSNNAELDKGDASMMGNMMWTIVKKKR